MERNKKYNEASVAKVVQEKNHGIPPKMKKYHERAYMEAQKEPRKGGTKGQVCRKSVVLFTDSTRPNEVSLASVFVLRLKIGDAEGAHLGS